MWKEQSARLHAWLKTTPDRNHGAKDFLQARFGVRPATSFTPGQNFGLAVDETMAAPNSCGAGAAARCGGI